MKKSLFTLILFILSFTYGFAQEPAKSSIKLIDKGNGGEIELTTSFKIDPTWHLYDIHIPDGGLCQPAFL